MIRTEVAGSGAGRRRPHPRAALRHLASRIQHAWFKFSWGAHVVGYPSAALGVLRLASLRFGRKDHAQVRLRSGATIGFDVPSQVPSALVMFRTPIDPEFPLLAALAAPDWVVIDVGAAIGQFSVFAALLPVGVVHAFEPSGCNIASLEQNIVDNALSDRVHIHQTALSDWEGEQQFTTQGNTYLSRPDQGEVAGLASETVPVRTLSGECARLGLDRVWVLKINVAGYEPEVLAGSAPMLAAGAVSILILLIGERSITWYQQCAGWGYRFFFFEPEARILREVADLELSTLEHPASPARHLIAVHRNALADVEASSVQVVLRSTTGPTVGPTAGPTVGPVRGEHVAHH